MVLEEIDDWSIRELDDLRKKDLDEASQFAIAAKKLLGNDLTDDEAIARITQLLGGCADCDMYCIERKDDLTAMMQRLSTVLGVTWFCSDYDPEDYEKRIVGRILELLEREKVYNDFYE